MQSIDRDERSHAHSTKRLVGCIDQLVSGCLHGWVMDQATPNVPVAVAVMHGDNVLGTGVACEPRADLVKAFGTGGKHGFAIPLQDMPDGESLVLTLRERESNLMIEATPFVIESTSEGLVPVIAGVEDVRLIVSVTNSRASRTAELVTLDDDRPVARSVLPFPSGISKHALPLPGSLFDGRAHLLGISMGGRVMARHAEILRSIITPWEHLRDKHLDVHVVGLQPMAAARYSSLMRQLRHSTSADHVRNILAALEVLNHTGFDPEPPVPLRLPSTSGPIASVIIPAFEAFDTTYKAVASAILAHNSTPFEVIIADDCSSGTTLDKYALLENARVVATTTNVGFNRNCQNAAQHARGRYLVFLNNDVEVTSGWLDALVSGLEELPDAGITGSKLLNTDGTLQEAGGIVWRTGQPWNLGRGANPIAPEFNYARRVDYVSGAALCISKALWDEVGGFSEEFAPAYYEDTDLAFKVRQRGRSVWYVPSSEVYHLEGKSHGTDVNSGVKRHQAINAPKFRRKWARVFASNGEEGERVMLAKDRGIVGRVLMIDHSTPTPDRDAGSYAAVQEMKLLQMLGLKVTFVPENMAHLGDYTTALQRRGVEVVTAPSFLSIRDFLRDRGSEFDLVYITRYDVAGRHVENIRKHSRAKVALNLADLHFLRHLRAVAEGRYDLNAAIAVRDDELRVIRSVDAVLSYNDVERAVILSHNLDDRKVFRCPWVIERKPTSRSFDDRAGMLFLGGFKHTPNGHAVHWFVKEVMPLIELPPEQKKLYVVGSHVTEEVRALKSDLVEIVGFVEDLTEWFERARVFVAPLRYGAGLKGKVGEAMARGLPIAATSVAIEGTGLIDGAGCAIGDSPRTLARAVRSLATDPEKWKAARETALARVGAWTPEAAARELARMLDFLAVPVVLEAEVETQNS